MSKYDKTFKAEAIRLALTSTQSIAKTANDLGIKEGTLYNWVNQAKQQGVRVANDQGQPANLVEELNRLRKENARLFNSRATADKVLNSYLMSARSFCDLFGSLWCY